MIALEGERSRNVGSVSTEIRGYFHRYPYSSAKACCKALGLEAKIYGGRARKVKHDQLRFNKSVVSVTNYGRPLRSLTGVHRQEFGFKEPVPLGFVAVLEEKAYDYRVGGKWYRSPNRNRQLQYFDDRVSIRVYPKSGTCRILPLHRMTYEELRVHVEDVFAAVLPLRATLSDSFGSMIRGLQIARQHRTFRVGPVTPFNVGYYEPSLGLRILADGSHPEYLEVHEGWPSWIPRLFEAQRDQSSAIEGHTKVISDFTTQIQSHLHAMKGIGRAADRLNETVTILTELLRKFEHGTDGATRN